MTFILIIPVPPDNFAHKYANGRVLLGQAEANVYWEARETAHEEDLEGVKPEDAVGGITAYRDRHGDLDFSTYGTFDPSKWEGVYYELKIALGEELVRQGLANEEDLEDL